MIVIDGFPMDLALSEEHRFPGEVTSYPVEQGADISDHIRVLPEEIALECIVSDTPIGEVAADATRTGDVLPAEAALAKLLDIREARRPVTIETSLRTFDNMGLEELTVPKDKDKSGGLFFSVKFKRMKIVRNARTRRRVASPMAGAGGSAKAKKRGLTEDIVVDDRILWRFGSPPGAPLKYRDNGDGTRTPLWQWAIVRQVKRTSQAVGAAAATVGQDRASTFTPAFSDTEYIFQFTGEASKLAATSTGIKAREVLNPAQRNALAKDLARDAAERLRDGLRDARSNEARDALAKKKSLPKGLSLDRLKRSTPRLQAPRTPIAAGGL